MRLAFFLLVLANLAFFVWTQGYLGGREEGREPQRLKEQLQPERIQVTPQAPPAVPPAAASPPTAAQQPQLVCRRLEGLAPADAERLRQAFEAGGLRASLHASEEPSGFLVNISALPNQMAADKKAGELKALGVTDFSVVQAGGNFAITLGSFNEENAARTFLQQVNKKGVRSARLETKAKTPGPASLEVRGAADAIAKQLSQLAGSAATAAIDCP